MGWCFATINNRLAEIFFDKKKNGRTKIWGHCYVKKKEYKTKKEHKWIREDTKRMKVIYRNKKYNVIEPKNF